MICVIGAIRSLLMHETTFQHIKFAMWPDNSRSWSAAQRVVLPSGAASCHHCRKQSNACSMEVPQQLPGMVRFDCCIAFLFMLDAVLPWQCSFLMSRTAHALVRSSAVRPHLGELQAAGGAEAGQQGGVAHEEGEDARRESLHQRRAGAPSPRGRRAKAREELRPAITTGSLWQELAIQSSAFACVLEARRQHIMKGASLDSL